MRMSPRLPARHRPWFLTAALGAVALAAPSCSLAGGDAAPRIGSAPGGQPTRPGPAASIYAQVVRQLVLVDHGYGRAPSPYRVVYVVDGPVPRAGDPAYFRPLRPRNAFTPAVKAAIDRAMRDGPRVVFIRREAHVMQGGGIVNGGVLVALGPIDWRRPGRAWVSHRRWAAGKDGQWATYVVARRGAGWRIAGFAGPIVIS
jgi:hypothetical protein